MGGGGGGGGGQGGRGGCNNNRGKNHRGYSYPHPAVVSYGTCRGGGGVAGVCDWSRGEGGDGGVGGEVSGGG